MKNGFRAYVNDTTDNSFTIQDISYAETTVIDVYNEQFPEVKPESTQTDKNRFQEDLPKASKKIRKYIKQEETFSIVDKSDFNIKLATNLSKTDATLEFKKLNSSNSNFKNNYLILSDEEMA